MNNLEKFKRYLESYQNKDIRAVSDMFSDDIRLRDWKISVKGKPSAVAETRKNFSSAKSLDIEILNSMENENSVCGELRIVVDESESLFVVDVVTFNREGLISSIMAYIGREN